MKTNNNEKYGTAVYKIKFSNTQQSILESSQQLVISWTTAYLKCSISLPEVCLQTWCCSGSKDPPHTASLFLLQKPLSVPSRSSLCWIFFQCMELYALVVTAAQESRWRCEMCSCLKLNAKVLSDTGFRVNFATVCLDIWWWWLIMDSAIVINMMYSAHWTSLACYIKLLMGCITKFNSNM